MSTYWINETRQAQLNAWLVEVCGQTQKTAVHFELKTSEKSKDKAHNRQAVETAYQAAGLGILNDVVASSKFRNIKAVLYAATGRPLDTGHGGSKVEQIRQANDMVKALLLAVGSNDKVHGYIGGTLKTEQDKEKLSEQGQNIARALFDQQAPAILDEAYKLHRAWVKAHKAPAKKAPAKKAPATIKKAPAKKAVS